MKKKLVLNTITSVLFQITTLICGFILPRLILDTFGSEVNGLVSSINQFLSMIAFLELGVGAVIQSSLYKPLAEKDSIKISKVLKSGDIFFKKIALILLVYVIGLTIFYPFIAKIDQSWLYTALLILAMSISAFAQYYFGIIDRLLLTADQRGYIQYTSQIITLCLNTVACVIVIRMAGSIQLVKLTTSIIFLIRPLILRAYINRHYDIDRKIELDEEPIKQKWNGIAQHVASVVLDNTDIIVLTLFSTLANVSIYSVYYMVVAGVKGLFLSGINGVQAVMGEYLAKNEKEKLENFFKGVEFTIHTVVMLLFPITAVLIVPFIQVYTKGVTDVNYMQPIFAYLLVAAHACHCLRLPYNQMILAGGHYKQTQNCHIIAVIINLGMSIVSVYYWGLIGVAIGTLVSMTYQTVWMAIYNSKNFIYWSIKRTIKQFFVDIITLFFIMILTSQFRLEQVSFIGWFIMAIKVSSIALLTSVFVNFVFYKEEMTNLVLGILRKINIKRI